MAPTIAPTLVALSLLVGSVSMLPADPYWKPILAGPAQAWEVGVPIRPFVFPQLDDGSDGAVYSIRNRNLDRTDGLFPPGISFDSETLTLSGMPERPTTGLREGGTIAAGDIILQATDDDGSDEIRIRWVLREVEPYYADLMADVQIWEVGEPAYFEVPPVDRGTRVWYRNGLDSYLPKGVFFDAPTRTIQGTPIGIGSGMANIWAQNHRSIAYHQVPWKIVQSGAPAWKGSASNRGHIRSAGSEPRRWVVGQQIVPFSVPVVDLNSASYTAEGLPDGLSFDPVSMEISGVPSEPTMGTIAVTASNESGNDIYRIPFTSVVVK